MGVPQSEQSVCSNSFVCVVALTGIIAFEVMPANEISVLIEDRRSCTFPPSDGIDG